MPGTKRKSNQYEVERILDKKVDGNMILYKVKWVGYRVPTWEASPNLATCKDVVRKFEKEYAKKMKKREAAAADAAEPMLVDPEIQKLIKNELPEGLAPIKILGSSKDPAGALFFAVEFKEQSPEGEDDEGMGDDEQPDEEEDEVPIADKNIHLISGAALKKECPLILIEYYERHAVFLTNYENGDNLD